MNKLTIHFLLERETKGAVRYQEVGSDEKPLALEQGAKIGTLYIRKSAHNSSLPAKLLVTVESRS